MKRTSTLFTRYFGPVAIRLDWHHYRRNGFLFTRGSKDGFVYETFLGIMRIHTGDPQAEGWTAVIGPLAMTVAWYYQKPSNKRDLKCRNPEL